MSRYQSPLKAILIVLVIALIADVIVLVVPIGGTNPDGVTSSACFFVMMAPLWLPFVIMLLRPTVARRSFKAVGSLAILSLAFFIRHASDRDPWQYWSGMICGASFCLTFAFWLGYVGSKERDQRLNPDEWNSPARDVAEPGPRSPLWDRELDG